MSLDLVSYIREVPDFPTQGILFRDITPLLGDPSAFSEAVRAMAAPFRESRVAKVLGIEARGFLFAAALACELGAGLVPARKSGKLPRTSIRATYGLEYGRDSLEIHSDALSRGERVLVADDVLATGGTARAAAELAEKLGADVVGFTFLIELGKLEGKKQLGGRRIHSVLMLE